MDCVPSLGNSLPNKLGGKSLMGISDRLVLWGKVDDSEDLFGKNLMLLTRFSGV